MSGARIYVMHAKEGMSAEFETALRKLADVIMDNIEACRGVEVLRDLGNERRFIFIERWDSEEAHQAAAPALSKLDVGSVIASLDGPPDGSYFDLLFAR